MGAGCSAAIVSKSGGRPGGPGRRTRSERETRAPAGRSPAGGVRPCRSGRGGLSRRPVRFAAAAAIIGGSNGREPAHETPGGGGRQMLQRRSDSTRLEAFSDGVFAFAATLLVVSLEVPNSFSELLADLSGMGAFALGFLALVLLWAVHNAYFRRYALEDGWTIALNACLLFVILFYVFPLKFVAA